jgi:hypothetical protein
MEQKQTNLSEFAEKEMNDLIRTKVEEENS